METNKEEDPNLEERRDSTDQTPNQASTNTKKEANRNSTMEETSPQAEVNSDPPARTQDSTEAEVKMLDNNQLKEESPP